MKWPGKQSPSLHGRCCYPVTSHPWHKSGPAPAAPQTVQAQSEVCTDAMVQIQRRDYLTLYLILYKYSPFYTFYAVK